MTLLYGTGNSILFSILDKVGVSLKEIAFQMKVHLFSKYTIVTVNVKIFEKARCFSRSSLNVYTCKLNGTAGVNGNSM